MRTSFLIPELPLATEETNSRIVAWITGLFSYEEMITCVEMFRALICNESEHGE